MSHTLSILDPEYIQWIKELSIRLQTDGAAMLYKPIIMCKFAFKQ